jgi:hypothetical protein
VGMSRIDGGRKEQAVRDLELVVISSATCIKKRVEAATAPLTYR